MDHACHISAGPPPSGKRLSVGACFGRWFRGIVLVLWSCAAFEPAPFEHTTFPLACTHATLACDSCHTTDLTTPIATECESCHLADAPASHGPDRTACGECHDDCGWGNSVSPHPEGFEAPEMHGVAANLQETVCTDCHGSDLTGGESGAVGCDECHAKAGHADWRTDCTFCHGGALDATGAPPEDLDNTTDEGSLTFASHHAHMDASEHAVYGCDQCHGSVSLSYVDALTDSGHWFDGSPGESEVDFSDGLSPAASWTGSGCDNAYCHSTGQGASSGDISDGTTPLACDDCHPGPSSGNNAFDDMSGEHKKHMEEGAECSDCHDDVVDASFSLKDATLHVNGEPDVALAPSTGMTISGGRCWGRCHGDEDHDEDNQIDW
jgi:hypothetical protein